MYAGRILDDILPVLPDLLTGVLHDSIKGFLKKCISNSDGLTVAGEGVAARC